MPPAGDSIVTVTGVVGFGPGLNVDFSRLTFHVPIHGSDDWVWPVELTMHDASNAANTAGIRFCTGPS